MSLLQLLFDRSTEINNETKLLLSDDDGTNSRIKNPDANDNRTFGLVSDDDYPNSRCPTVKCTILTIYYNNNNNNNYNSSENNVDNNFKGNAHHLLLHSRADYNSALTGSTYSATERNANDTFVDSDNEQSEKNADNNSNSNNNNNCCADSDDNNDNNKDGNFVCAFAPPPSDSNADNASPGRKNKNNVMRLPRFIGHPNEIVFRVFK